MISRALPILGVALALAFCACGRIVDVSFETGAIANIKSIQTAQVQYYSQFGRYAASFSELGTAQLIKDGYKFTMTAAPTGFAVNASPTVYGETGRRTFYSDQTLVIHQNWTSEPATSSSPELK